MFEKPTVFILGAGASWHYGYPTGEELVARVIEVCEKLTGYFTTGFQHQSGSVPAFALRNHPSGQPIPVNVWRDAAEEAIQLGRRLKEVNPVLIDYFLAQNADLHDIGRLAIALVIFSCETAYHRSGGNPNHVQIQKLRIGRGESTTNIANLNLAAFKDDWLRFVLYNMTSGCTSPEQLSDNRVNFVSFNYDTSLEQRLYSGLANISHFGKSHVQSFMGGLRYLHVYGKLREKIDEQWAILDSDVPQIFNQTFHEYPQVLNKVFEASKGIRTIDGDDKLANEEILTHARHLIAEADIVYVLGFGFDKSNVERLRLETLRPKGPKPRSVYFTNFRGLDSVSMAASRSLTDIPSQFLSGSAQTLETVRQYEGVQTDYRYQMSIKNVYDAIAEDFEAMGSATS
jgi:hypothetical protein